MDDLISRQAAIDVLATMQGLCTSKAALIQNSKIWQQIKDLPSTQPERKSGRWIDAQYPFSKCSICECYFDTANNIGNFCPNCGAKMVVME